MKNLAKRAILRSGLLGLAAKLRKSGAAILMYHSVLDDPRQQDDLLGGIAHSKAVFRSQMELLAGSFRPVSLDHVLRFLKEGRDLPRRTVVVTFDDGYVDNSEIAAPILDQVGVPATFYVTIDWVENARLPWPARLRYAFRTTKKSSWADVSGTNRPLGNAMEREEAFLSACDECCKLAGEPQERYVADLERKLAARVPAQPGSLMMSYDQVRSLARKGHIIGSHTLTHPNMAYVNLNDARREMTDSKMRLEQQLGIAVAHFSYPCPALSPHWTAQTAVESRNAGYETAVTTDVGLARRGDNPHCLKRIRPTKTLEGLHWNLERAFAAGAI
jgi:peptidoglycan/xylan/chitin deacetylase (PgdA/CDA1 family)